jgi:hemerythrin-like domain-containing protein
MVAQLVQEHEAVKALWKRIEPSVSSVAAGHTPAVDAVLLEAIVQHFFAHVHFEEHDFLPLAQKILSRHSSEMAALGMALHTRHGHHEQEG